MAQNVGFLPLGKGKRGGGQHAGKVGITGLKQRPLERSQLVEQPLRDRHGAVPASFGFNKGELIG